MDYLGNGDLVKTFSQNSIDLTTYAKSSITENAITNQMADSDIRAYDSSVTYLSRSDWNGTFPTSYGDASKKWEAPAAVLEALKLNLIKLDPSAKTPVNSHTDEAIGHINLVTLRGAEYDSPFWDTLLDQLSLDEMYELVRVGGYSTVAIESIAKPGTIDKDGPAGISSTLVGGAGCFGFPIEMVLSSSYNVELVERIGELVGEDGLYSKTHGWYAPAMNNHRTPFSGRNFEYFSEDGIQGGILGAALVQGVQRKGVYAYIKHFAFNDQETNRTGVATYINEQAIREIYLKPFQISIEKGEALALMVSMNRVGNTWVGAHKGLMTTILRDEWGFKGIAITDQASIPAAFRYEEIVPGLIAGTDLWLNTGSANWHVDGYKDNPTFTTSLRTASKHILYTIVNSHAMNGINATSKIVKIMPVWQGWVVAMDVVLGLGAVTGAVFVTLSMLKAIKAKKKQDSPAV
jgi:beta-glucosidase